MRRELFFEYVGESRALIGTVNPLSNVLNSWDIKSFEPLFCKKKNCLKM